MKQYRNYAIYINYNKFTEAERSAALHARDVTFYTNQTPGRVGGAFPESMKLENLLNPHATRYLAEQEAYRKKHGDVNDWQRDYREFDVDTKDKMREEVRPEKATKESVAYEKRVYRQLDIILGTAIGRLLLDSINAAEKIWIVVDEEGPGVASTTPGVVSNYAGGGVRLYYDPDDFDPKMEYFTPDDVLFHELVHAYRSAKRVDYHRVLREYRTAEEFLAIHLQNVYMALRGKSRFYISHSNSSLAKKEDVYANIATDWDTVEAFNYFRFHEPLTVNVANMHYPSYNVWRDAAQINALAGYSWMNRPLLKFGLPMMF
jgi:hypothetical protein